MKHIGWKFYLGTILVALSTAAYALHYVFFRDAHHIFIYLLGDIAFVFIEVLMVTLIIHQVLEMREKRNRIQKLNMVIGAFFSEVGTSLLKELRECDSEIESLQASLSASEGNKLEVVEKALKNHAVHLTLTAKDFRDLKGALYEKKTFLLRLLENQNLLEHESFTDTLWAVFHLIEELDARDSLDEVPKGDLHHLIGDATRAYKALCGEWIQYMKHLKTSYPYLYSLALRTNPFDKNASATVVE